MSEELKEKHFKPKAHILTLLGNELIKNPVMAIYELVKNSYDADATRVDVRFRDVEDNENASIIIEDNGIGMTSEIVENVWLEPGSDHRKPFNKETGKREIIKTPILKRIPMGEKGVGRFAVHKLSSHILLISRPMILTFDEEEKNIIKSELADYEIQLFINWNDFNQSKHLSDIPIKWKIKKDISSFRFQNNSGTYIRLGKLKESWTKGMAREIKSQTMSMLSPKIKENTFKINLDFDNKWLTDFPSVEKILDEAPYKLTAFIDRSYNLTYEYCFNLANNTKIGKHEIKMDRRYDRNIKGDIRPFIRKMLESKEVEKDKVEQLLQEFDNNENLIPFGNIFLEFNSYDLDPISMRDYSSDSSLTKLILREHAGIKVFKGDLRIYDYGEKGNDWLGIDLERVQNTEWFSNNQNIGYVYLEAENSECLIEKTNREGFIKNDAYDLFYTLLKYILNEFRATRLIDRQKWLNLNTKSSRNLFEEKISQFKIILDKSDLSTNDKKQLILDEVDKLERKYEDDKKTLLIPAGVGMTASVALHEIEKLVPRMHEAIFSKPIEQNLLKNQITELEDYTNGILSVLRKGGETAINIQEFVNKSISNYRMKLESRKILVNVEFENTISTINCDKRLAITMFMNLIDNSMYWLDTIYKTPKKILIKCLQENESIVFIIADNGPGFKDDISDLIRPFYTRKSNGIGIGLYLIDTIMMKYGKFDIIDTIEECELYNLDKSYDGAIVKLIFSKNQN